MPPILIVHLKRFNYVNNKWVKSQKVVNFPFENFDPTPYLASVPQETILRHKELIEHGNTHKMNSNAETSASEEEFPEHPIVDSIKEVEVTDIDNGNDNENEQIQSEHKLNESSRENTNNIQNSHSVKNINTNNNNNNNYNNYNNKNNSNNNNKNESKVRNSINSSKRTPSRSIHQRKRLVSTSLIKTPVIDGAFIDYHDHRLEDGQDPFDLKYNLYAVVVSISIYPKK